MKYIFKLESEPLWGCKWAANSLLWSWLHQRWAHVSAWHAYEVARVRCVITAVRLPGRKMSSVGTVLISLKNLNPLTSPEVSPFLRNLGKVWPKCHASLQRYVNYGPAFKERKCSGNAVSSAEWFLDLCSPSDSQVMACFSTGLA